MKLTISRSAVMSAAWKLVRAGVSLSDAMRQAWKDAKLAVLCEALAVGFVLVTFRKVDGTVTTRKATRNAELVPDPDKPRGGAAGRAVIPFWSDTDAGWRSFKADNLITFKAA